MYIKKKIGRAVYIIDGVRTPFLKATGIGPFSAADLAVNAGRSLLARYSFSPQNIDQLILGCAMPGPDEANIARIVALRLGCGLRVPAWTVMRNCASGLQALDSAANDIALGRSEMVLAGGTEAMSHTPLLYNRNMVEWFANWSSKQPRGMRGFGRRAAMLAQLGKFEFMSPVIALLRGLTDPTVGINMGQTAENLAYDFEISRHKMDAFSTLSHQRAATAWQRNEFAEVEPIFANNGEVFTQDNGIRADSSIEKLAKLKPYFDKKFGNVTPGNSSQITDGACMLLLASEDAVKNHNLPVLGRVIDVEWAALDPAKMGLGPIHATIPLMRRNKLKTHHIGYWEINEAFAAQVLSCLTAWDDQQFCNKHFGMHSCFESIDRARLNVRGGAIAIGHPIGASGARIVLQLLRQLKASNEKLGIASLCIGGGQGGAMLVENISKESL